MKNTIDIFKEVQFLFQGITDGVVVVCMKNMFKASISRLGLRSYIQLQLQFNFEDTMVQRHFQNMAEHYHHNCHIIKVED